MCSTPITINGYELSCRECNQCVSTYKNAWVSRCVAEKQILSNAYCVTLTYADVDGVPPLGARVFRYKDVSDFWKRLRHHGRKQFGKDFEIKYVVVGEKGSRFLRCHYHGVIFSNYPIHLLGDFNSARGDSFAFKQRLDWSIWGNGFVEFQEATKKGLAYVLKYILKSRMTAARSKGMAREGKTEWLASSYLWCSKVPAIGERWLWEKVHDLVSKGMCPPALRIPLPGGSDWFVSGELQKALCLFLRDANEAYRDERGRDLAGWKFLVESVSDEIELSHTGEVVRRKPWEWLNNGETDEDEQPDEVEDLGPLEEYYGALSDSKRYAGKAGRCFGVKACTSCQRYRTPEQKADDQTVEDLWRETYGRERETHKRFGGSFPSFRFWLAKQGLVAEGCFELTSRPEAVREESEYHQRAHERAKRLQISAR